jgi:phosphatidylethanolamine-binding protein (PEBP) family uncharacterized protein
MTCDGRAFGTGANPKLTWAGAPDGALGLALLCKDISILADGKPTKERLAHRLAMWDIPKTAVKLPAGTTGGYHFAEITGALEWTGRNNHGFFPPCPNPFPKSDRRFSQSLVTDSHSFTLDALPMDKLVELPAPGLDATSGMPTGGYVVKLGRYIESLPALAVTEYRGTSPAGASSFSAPAPAQYPCAAMSAIDGGVSIDAGDCAMDGGGMIERGGTRDGGGAGGCLE